jgi:hypothetical protein
MPPPPPTTPGGSLDARLLLYWVNSIDLPSCLLVSRLTDLASGRVLRDLATLIYTGARPADAGADASLAGLDVSLAGTDASLAGTDADMSLGPDGGSGPGTGTPGPAVYDALELLYVHEASALPDCLADGGAAARIAGADREATLAFLSILRAARYVRSMVGNSQKHRENAVRVCKPGFMFYIFFKNVPSAQMAVFFFFFFCFFFFCLVLEVWEKNRLSTTTHFRDLTQPPRSTLQR